MHFQHRFFLYIADYFLPSFQQRAASVYGDLRFHSARRLLLEQFVSRPSTTNKAYSYLYSYKDPNDQPDEGTPHGADLDCVSQSTKASVCPTMASHWVNFAYNKDPNGAGTSREWRTKHYL